ncbi:MAG: hypothetical protein PUC50_16315 [Bacteroidales bacterium]|nr:hypothetical protein [Bacteroidales bacterium]
MSTNTLKEPKKKKSPLPSTKAELYAALDEAERQFEAGEYVSNDEVMRWIDNELANDEQHIEMSLAV